MILKFNLEKGLEELERIVSYIESNTLELESGLSEFGKGKKLAHECYEALKQAEKNIQTLMEQDNEASLNDSQFNLEKGLEELKNIVSHIENNTLALEPTLSEFEKGIKLIRQSNAKLKQAEQSVQILMEKEGETSLMDYFENQEDDTTL